MCRRFSVCAIICIKYLYIRCKCFLTLTLTLASHQFSYIWSAQQIREAWPQFHNMQMWFSHYLCDVRKHRIGYQLLQCSLCCQSNGRQGITIKSVLFGAILQYRAKLAIARCIFSMLSEIWAHHNRQFISTNSGLNRLWSAHPNRFPNVWSVDTAARCL